MEDKKENRGGARKGAGRKEGTVFAEPTTVMRIPNSLVPLIKDYMEIIKKTAVPIEPKSKKNKK